MQLQIVTKNLGLADARRRIADAPGGRTRVIRGKRVPATRLLCWAYGTAAVRAEEGKGLPDRRAEHGAI